MNNLNQTPSTAEVLGWIVAWAVVFAALYVAMHFDFA